MKICITSISPSLESKVDPKFGRCGYFIFTDTEKLGFESIENSHAVEGGGAGIKSGQLVSDHKVEVILTGNVGPNAYDTLKAAGIKIITGVSGTVKEVISKYKNGELSKMIKKVFENHKQFNNLNCIRETEKYSWECFVTKLMENETN